jgi:hypothetical protein
MGNQGSSTSAVQKAQPCEKWVGIIKHAHRQQSRAHFIEFVLSNLSNDRFVTALASHMGAAGTAGQALPRSEYFVDHKKRNQMWEEIDENRKKLRAGMVEDSSKNSCLHTLLHSIYANSVPVPQFTEELEHRLSTLMHVREQVHSLKWRVSVSHPLFLCTPLGSVPRRRRCQPFQALAYRRPARALHRHAPSVLAAAVVLAADA